MLKFFFDLFHVREAPLNNMVHGTTWSREKSVYLSGCLLMTTESLLLPVFWEEGAFLFVCMIFPSNRTVSVSRMFSQILIKYFSW